jgi:ABC-type transporter Mla subunit MlaD
MDFITASIAWFDTKEKAYFIAGLILALATLIWLGLQFRYHRRFINSVKPITQKLAPLPEQLEYELRVAKANTLFETEVKDPTLASLWRDYARSIRPDIKQKRYVNVISPHDWFSLNALPNRGYELWCSTWAGAFLTIGLFFTFLGLSAALIKVGSMDGADSAAMKAAISGILNVSSAKFITSMAGILAYIWFSFWTRYYSSVQRKLANDLATAIQHLTTPMTPEALLYEQNRVVREQRDLLKSFSSDLATAIDEKLEGRLKVLSGEFGGHLEQQVGRLAGQLDQLNKGLPEATSQPIVTAVHTISGEFAQSNKQGLEEVMGSLVESLKRMTEISATLGAVVEGLRGSGSDFGREIKDASRHLQLVVERLGQDAQNRSGQINRQVDALAGELTEAARTFGDISTDMDGAFSDLLNTFIPTANLIKETMNQGGSEASAHLQESAKKAGVELREGADYVKNEMGSIEKRVHAIGKQLESIPDTINLSLQEILLALTSSATTAANDFGDSIDQAGSRFGKSVTDAGEGFRGNVGDSAKLLAESSQEIRKTASQFADNLGKIHRELNDLPDAVAKQITKLKAAGDVFTQAGNKVEDAATSLNHAANPVKDAAADIAQSVLKYDDLQGALSDTLKQTLEQLTQTAKAARTVFETHEQRFGEVDKEMAEAIQQLRNGVITISVEFQNALVEYNQKIGNAMQDVSGRATELNDLIDKLKPNDDD